MFKRIITILLFVILSSKSFAEIGFGIDFGAAYTSDSRVDSVIQERNNQGMQNITASYDDGAIFIRGFVSQSSTDASSLELGLFQATGFSADYTVANETGSDDYNVAGIDFLFNLNTFANLKLKAGGHYSFINGDEDLVLGSTSHDIKNTNKDGAGIVVGVGYSFGDIRTGISYYGGIGGDSDAYMTVGTVGFAF